MIIIVAGVAGAEQGTADTCSAAGLRPAPDVRQANEQRALMRPGRGQAVGRPAA